MNIFGFPQEVNPGINEQWIESESQNIPNRKSFDVEPPVSVNVIYESREFPTDEKTSHKGVNIPGGKYVDITRNLNIEKGFRHFSPDISGKHLVTDNVRIDERNGKSLRELFIGTLSSGDNPELKVQYLLHTHSVLNGQPSHVHPFFSPDSRMAFFNADMGILPRVFMVTGYKFPEY